MAPRASEICRAFLSTLRTGYLSSHRPRDSRFLFYDPFPCPPPPPSKLSKKENNWGFCPIFALKWRVQVSKMVFVTSGFIFSIRLKSLLRWDTILNEHSRRELNSREEKGFFRLLYMYVPQKWRSRHQNVGKKGMVLTHVRTPLQSQQKRRPPAT